MADTKNPAENYQPGAVSSSEAGQRRDPEDRPTHDRKEVREKMLDKTLADSFPTSDPPSSIPDPSEDDSMAA
jgi:hypothetical protein